MTLDSASRPISPFPHEGQSYIQNGNSRYRHGDHGYGYTHDVEASFSWLQKSKTDERMRLGVSVCSISRKVH